MTDRERVTEIDRQADRLLDTDTDRHKERERGRGRGKGMAPSRVSSGCIAPLAYQEQLPLANEPS